MITVAQPEVTRIGETGLAYDFVTDTYDIERFMDVNLSSGDAEDIMEFAGRGCYQSFHRPNPATRETADYLRNIIRQGHESVLEHATVSFYVTGVSRALTHELVRHRMFNFSQQSQRFVNEEEAAIVLPPAVDPDSNEADLIRIAASEDLSSYRVLVDALQKGQGLKRKQAREAARAVLPNCLETRLTITGNHRAWRQFLWRRLDPAADAEIRRFAQLILDDLSSTYPVLYEDIKEYFNE